MFDGVNTLVLPVLVADRVEAARKASTLGLLSFAGLFAALLIQPVAGGISDRVKGRAGRKGLLGLGVLLALVFLALLGIARSLVAIAAGYLLLQAAGSLAQAAQQGFIPDLVSPGNRGKASGWKAFMDIGGSTLGFVLLGQILGRGQPGLALAAIGLALVIAIGLVALLVREPRLETVTNTGSETGNKRLSLSGAFRIDLRKHRSFVWLVVSRFLFLLGTYAVGRFLLYFVADRLGLSSEEAARQAGGLLAGLALVTVLFAPVAGWAADRWGRIPVVIFAALVSAVGAILLIFAAEIVQIFAFGALLSLGSAAFASANWAMTADLVPANEAARFFGLANFGTTGAVAAAGLFGLLVDGWNTLSPGLGYQALFASAALAFILSAVALRWVQAPDYTTHREQRLQKKGEQVW